VRETIWRQDRVGGLTRVGLHDDGVLLMGNCVEGADPVTVAVDSRVGEDQHVEASLMEATMETEGG
jgi:hypothetical protein